MNGMDEVALLEVRRPLKVKEYVALADLGMFEGERVELLRGMVVRKPTSGAEDAWTIEAMNEVLVRLFGDVAAVRPGLPLEASDDSMPEPDFALVEKSPVPRPHPKAAALLIEVSVSSLALDLRVKAPLYAETGSPEYWLVDVLHRKVEVFRRPVAGQWSERLTVGPGDRLRPVAFPQIEVAVDRFLLPASH